VPPALIPLRDMDPNELPRNPMNQESRQEYSRILKTPIFLLGDKPHPFIRNEVTYLEDEETPRTVIINKPRAEKIALFRDRFPELFKGKIHREIVSRYELNFLNVSDLLVNWGILPTDTQINLVKIIESNWDRRNSSQWGIKKRKDEREGAPLAEHLILLGTMEVQNMVKYGHRIVSCNVIDDRGFRDPNLTNLSIIDPRASTRRIRKWLSKQKPQNLMNEMGAMIVLFPSPVEIHDVGEDTWRARERFNNFFRGVEKQLHGWKKQKSISAFFASHEISVSSIWGSRFNPHTHAVIWLSNKSLLFLRRAAARGDVQYLPKVHTKWNSLKKFIPYTMRVSRIAQAYSTEFPEEGDPKDIVRFNTLAVQTLGKLIDLWKHTNAKGKDRISKSSIPTVLDGVFCEDEEIEV